MPRKQQWKVGDWVSIRPMDGSGEDFLIVGKVLGPSERYKPGIFVETVYKYDPDNIDVNFSPGQWPTNSKWLIERFG